MSGLLNALRNSVRWSARCARCAVCDLRSDGLVCNGCEADFFSPHIARCGVCAIRLPEQLAHRVCGRCSRDTPQFDATLALADYQAPVDGMIVALKFQAQLALAPVFGSLLAQRAAERSNNDSIVLPVPLAFERHAERGFNQAHEIARSVSRRLRVPCIADALLRVRHTGPQQTLVLSERRRNVRGAFALARANDQRLHGKHVFVVDDVMTTGSTLDEVAKTLKRAGAQTVVNLIVARTP